MKKMKRLLTMFLAVMLTASLMAMPAWAITRAEDVKDRYIWSDFFDIEETNEIMLPGQTYYFPANWGGNKMDDDFFDVYKTSVSITSVDTGAISTTAARSRVDFAEFVKGSDGYYYFCFRAKASFAYLEDVAIRVYVQAVDRKDDKFRGEYEMYLDIGYSQNQGSVEYISSSTYDVDSTLPLVEFDGDLKNCQLNFEDGSYYLAQFATRNRKYNLLYTETENAVIRAANPNANLKFLSFPTGPSFSGQSTLRIYAPRQSYLYEIGSNNTLTQLSSKSSGDYLNTQTNRLGSYVASDVPLKASGTTVGGNTAGSGTVSQSGSSGTQINLASVISNNFSNKFTIAAYGTTFENDGVDVLLRCKPDYSHLNTATLRIYVYDQANNKLIYIPTAGAYVGTDGAIYFKSSFKGMYVITDSALTK